MDKTRLKSLQAVVFDMDGLMFDSERYIQTAWNQAGTMLGYGTLGDHIEKTLGFNGTKRREFFLDLCGQDFPYDEFLELYRSLYFDRVRKEGIPAKEGLHETLEVLKKLGIRMGVATSSSRENTLKNLEREQISGYFQTVITGDMIQHGKPEPDIYLEACRKLGAEPQDANSQEDSQKGIKAAARAGMMPVMITDLIKDTTEVDDILFGRYDSLAEFAREIEECLGSSRAEKEK